MIVLENRWLHIEIDSWQGTFTEILNRPSNLHLISEGFRTDVPPWILYTAERPGGQAMQSVSFETCDVTLRPGGTTVDFSWKVREGLTIKASVSLAKDSPEAVFNCRVDNRTKNIAAAVEFPVIRGIGVLGNELNNTYLAHPVARGFLFRAPFRALEKTNLLRHVPYPCGYGSPMQFFSYYAKDSGSFYFACHDPKDTSKEFNFFREGKFLTASIMHKSWDLKPAGDLAPGYPVILGVSPEGDWRAGCDRYRLWATGKGAGSPDWFPGERLEDRVKRKTAAKWLAEETGICTFGITASRNASKWIREFHSAAGAPVFHIFGYDWAGWSRPEQGPLPGLNEVLQKIGMQPSYGTIMRLNSALKNLLPRDAENEEKLKKAMKEAGVDTATTAAKDMREAFGLYLRFKPEFGEGGSPAKWFPANFSPENMDAVRKNGDFFALLIFDFLSFGHDLKKYGLLSDRSREEGSFDVLGGWMHPATRYWQEFHASRDAEISRQCGADAGYYDVSASSLGDYSDRSDLGIPAGSGRGLTEAYRRTYALSREAATKASRRYIPRGTEVITENFMGVLDYAHCHTGAGVQNDMEGSQFMELMKAGYAQDIPMWSFVYHEYGPVCLDGFCKLSKEFGAYFYYIASRVCLEGSILELNYEFSSIELFPGMSGKSFQLSYNRTIIEDENPFLADPEKIEFLKEVSAARTRFARQYLAYGKMERPFKFTAEAEFVELGWHRYNTSGGRKENGTQMVPAVIHEAWSHAGKTLGALFVNLYGKAQTAVVDIDLRGREIQKGPWKLFLVSRDKEPVFLGDLSEQRGRVRLTLEPRKIYLLEIKGHHE